MNELTLKKPRNNLEKAISHTLKKLKVPFEYETLKLPYVTESNYWPDFILADRIFEGKGYFRPEDRRKMLDVKRMHPDRRIIIVFQIPNKKLYKNSKTTYAEWAEKNGFEWCTVATLKDYIND